MLLDGAHLVATALDAHVRLETVITDGRHTDLANRAERGGATVFEAGAQVFEAVSPVQSPTGIVAIGRWTPAETRPLLAAGNACLLGLVGVQDPGNVGAAIRTADALGATGVMALEGTADPAGFKALRGAMGSTFRLPVGRGRLADVHVDEGRPPIRVVATVSHDGQTPSAALLASPVIILLGNEGAGLPDDVVAVADARVQVPMRAGVNSLNVAVTAAILLWEAAAHRGARG